MNEVWREIEQYLKKNVPSVLSTLNGPISEDELRKLEDEIGHSLPEDFRAYLKVHNGQDDPSRLETLCEEGTLLSSEAILKTYRMLNDINESLEQGPVEWWSKYYLPITDCEGDHLAIDLRSGAVVMHIHDNGIEAGIANTFSDWFKSKLQIFKDGKFSVSDGYLDYWEYNS